MRHVPRRDACRQCGCDIVLAADRFAADAPVADRHHPINRPRDVRIMCDDDGGQVVALVHLPQQIEDLLRSCRIEFAGRLVGQQQIGMIRQRHGNRHALLLPAGQLLQTMIAVLPQSHGLQQFTRPVAFAREAHACHGHRQLHIFLRGEIGHQIARHLLPHKPHPQTAIAIELAFR